MMITTAHRQRGRFRRRGRRHGMWQVAEEAMNADDAAIRTAMMDDIAARKREDE